MRSCKDTCDDQAVPRRPTGKTPVRNLRSPDEVWLPALAKTLAEGTTVTDVINSDLHEYGSTPPARELTFTEWPDAPHWLDANYPAWRDCAAALGAATAGLADQEYAGVALWLAITSHPGGRKQQHRLIAGFLLLRARTTTARRWREGNADLRALLRAINNVLHEHLPPSGPARATARQALNGKEKRQ
jgi:hypothetical protein